MEDKDKKYFCKIAGADTIGAEMSPAESVALLKEAVNLYYDLEHPNLIKIMKWQRKRSVLTKTPAIRHLQSFLETGKKQWKGLG